VSERLERYKKAKQDRLDGKFNGAPLYHSFPRLGEVVPAIPRGMQLMLLAGNGVGKSQGVIGLFVISVYRLIKKYNYKAKLYIFLLEDPATLFEDRLFCAVMYLKYKIVIDPLQLNSVKKNLVDDTTEAKFEEVDKTVEDILSHCIIEENISNPTGIYKYLRTISGKEGKHYTKKSMFKYTKLDGSEYEEEKIIYDRYEPDDPELHNIVIVDNLNNLASEYDDKQKKELDTKGCISKWTKDYSRKNVCKHWGYSVINVMQTDLATDRKQLDFKGNVMIDKVEPNLASLGEDKTASRAHHLILALFSPDRFGIDNYEGYDITKLGDKFRSLIVLKSNFGSSNVKLPLYFNGSCSYFEELPKVKDINYSKYT